MHHGSGMRQKHSVGCHDHPRIHTQKRDSNFHKITKRKGRFSSYNTNQELRNLYGLSVRSSCPCFAIRYEVSKFPFRLLVEQRITPQPCPSPLTQRMLACPQAEKGREGDSLFRLLARNAKRAKSDRTREETGRKGGQHKRPVLRIGNRAAPRVKPRDKGGSKTTRSRACRQRRGDDASPRTPPRQAADTRLPGDRRRVAN